MESDHRIAARAAAYHNRGLALCQHGDWAGAARLFAKTAELLPEQLLLWNCLGLALRQAGRPSEARPALQRATGLNPDDPDLWLSYGDILAACGEWPEAVAAFRRALKLSAPERSIDIFLRIAACERQAGRFVASEQAWRAAARLRPDDALVQNGLAMAKCRLGKVSQAVSILRRAAELESCPSEVFSNLLFAMLHDPGASPRTVAARHRAWAARYETNAEPRFAPAIARKRIRIGYVSADLRDHSVGSFFAPLLRAHDRSRFAISCYSASGNGDDATRSMACRDDRWRTVASLDDEALAERIRDDRIDVLVDLSGHTAGNRLGALARKPARVQVAYLGYPATTGMAAMDYRLTDSFVDPPGESERWYTEKLVRLAPGFLCYEPPAGAPCRQPRPHRPVTFGCFANRIKINRRMVGLWSRILKCVPGSILILKSQTCGEPAACRPLLKDFGRFGVAPDRIEFRGAQPSRCEHLAHYSDVDIALDTYPYSGTTTTCEALWMGAPVLALCGRTPVSRTSGSLLTQLGLEDWVAFSEDAYVGKAVRFARQRAFEPLHECLRSRFASSCLFDAARLARSVESAFQSMLP